MKIIDIMKFVLSHPVNRERKMRAVAEFLKWQMVSRMIDGNVVYNWIGESKFLVEKGITGLTGNIYTGLHEFEEMCFILHYLRSKDLFVDVGANAGSYTILACAVAKSDGIAFEPVPKTFNRLKTNVFLNGLEGKVQCIEKVVGSNSGVVKFTSEGDTTNHVLSETGETETAILSEMVSLDEVLKDRMPSVIKIDVEGYETKVIQGAKKILKKESMVALIVELNGSGDRYSFSENIVFDMITDSGYGTYSYDPFKRCLKNDDRIAGKSGNVLFVKNECLSFVKERLMKSKSISVKGRDI